MVIDRLAGLAKTDTESDLVEVREQIAAAPVLTSYILSRSVRTLRPAPE
jgi:hypothetical protein